MNELQGAEKTEATQPLKKRTNPLRWLPWGKLFLPLAILLALALGALGMRSYLSLENKATRLGFEDMGELATQTAYCTEINVTEASRELWGVTIPFTQSKYIYSYDVVIKAGLDFTAVEWIVDENTVTVKLPQVEVLSCELNLDSFRIYHEAESIFRPITLEENNTALATLKQSAQDNAIANGLLENARLNAEAILRCFFAQAYDPAEYQIRFQSK